MIRSDVLALTQCKSYKLIRQQKANKGNFFPVITRPEFLLIAMFNQLIDAYFNIKLKVSSISLPPLQLILNESYIIKEDNKRFLNANWNYAKSDELSLSAQEFHWEELQLECIQVAACGVAVLEDFNKLDDQQIDHLINRCYQDLSNLDDLSSDLNNGMTINLVHQERDRQEKMFGKMPRNLDLLVYFMIILEELGEVAEYLLIPNNYFLILGNPKASVLLNSIVTIGLKAREWLTKYDDDCNQLIICSSNLPYSFCRSFIEKISIFNAIAFKFINQNISIFNRLTKARSTKPRLISE
jgi:hypothetical protein